MNVSVSNVVEIFLIGKCCRAKRNISLTSLLAFQSRLFLFAGKIIISACLKGHLTSTIKYITLEVTLQRLCVASGLLPLFKMAGISDQEKVCSLFL